MSRHGERFESGAARVRVCIGGFALSIGDEPPIIVDRKAAQNIVHALTYALLATVTMDPPPPARRKRPTLPRPAKLVSPRPAKRQGE